MLRYHHYHHIGHIDLECRGRNLVCTWSSVLFRSSKQVLRCTTRYDSLSLGQYYFDLEQIFLSKVDSWHQGMRDCTHIVQTVACCLRRVRGNATIRTTPECFSKWCLLCMNLRQGMIHNASQICQETYYSETASRHTCQR